MYLKSSIPINAVQIWMYTAFSEVPTKLVTFRRCFRCLKKVSISHLSLYKAATVDAFQVKLYVKNSYSALFMLSQKRTNRIFEPVPMAEIHLGEYHVNQPQKLKRSLPAEL